MKRLAFLSFSAIAYAVFLSTFLYLIAFVAGLPILPKSVDHGGGAPVIIAVLVDLLLITAFALQHSIMARPGFKRLWTMLVPEPIERSIYVLAASLALILLFMLWQPVPDVLWRVGGSGAVLLWAVFGLGWLIVLLSTFLISHFELFGLKQSWDHVHGRARRLAVFRTPFFYRLVRHPLYSGFFIAFWATPYMTLGHLMFATGMSTFMLVAIRFEERDLVGTFGEDYVRYRARTGMLAPRLRRG
ncbi:MULTISPECIES: methanethiol S-methyltransferase [Sphingobium]|uniref:methanethiol S-methyltransferase n=1 Tax=Sphingobium fuliginis (strain ATCC 27551) TaxID=336203 RepID=A0ABQ1EXQ4_SPHSA|nr:MULTISPECIES: methanethiol S-methyltransferase [Sphingobium]RYL98187.1 isoprenylcysteine carboxylmethyltransferase family protein [Sphingobium fuliginis]WDA34905.1 isoprenylcysteine carboxylmethyltransferase family protein [Sphingobium sp. YC-XJ3]GFZ91249.1 membrane protein [Sphingobium fuliginis]